MRLSHINKTYHNKNNTVKALTDINLEFKDKGIITILGPSGSGKTTLLNIISGLDSHYEGEKECYEKVEIIEQNIMLFESMSVLDNLLICGTKEDCLKLLEQFDLKDETNKKVKNLSIGQKKRVQIMRSLLMKPDILLCDEPTASIDYDNKKIVMNMLKTISEACCVIVVTHELDIAEMYSDRIITIDNGKIVDDQVIHQKDNNEVKEKISHKKNMKQNIEFVFKNIKSRRLYHIGSILLLFCIVFLLFVSVNMIQTTELQINKNISTYYGKNIISLTPDEEFNEDSWAFEHFDEMNYSQVKDVVNQVDEIQGYSFGMNVIFSRVNYIDDSLENIVDPENETIDEYNESKLNSNKRPMTPHNLIDIIDGLYIYWSPEVPYIQLNHDDANKNYYTLVYQIPSGREVELLYGRQPTKDNEIVVDYSLAEVLCSLYQKKTPEDLLNQNISFFNDMLYEDVGVENPEWNFKVVGVTPNDSIYEYQIFIKDDAWMNSLVSTYDIEEDQWYFNEVNFFVDPTSDLDAVETKIDECYQGNESHFEKKIYDEINWYNLKRVLGHFDESKDILDTTFILQGSIAGAILIFALYTIIECLSFKRMKKENLLLNRYGYSSLKIGLMKKVLYMLLAAVLCFVLGSLICSLMNNLFEVLYQGYDLRNAFMSFNVLEISFILIIALIVVIVQEVIFNVCSTR